MTKNVFEPYLDEENCSILLSSLSLGLFLFATSATSPLRPEIHRDMIIYHNVFKDFEMDLGFRNRHQNVFKDLAAPNIDLFDLGENKI